MVLESRDPWRGSARSSLWTSCVRPTPWKRRANMCCIWKLVNLVQGRHRGGGCRAPHGWNTDPRIYGCVWNARASGRIARHYSDWYGVQVDPGNVVVTTGSSGAFVLSFLAAFDSGDSVALASPGYPAYRNILTALGISVVDIPVGPKINFQLTVPVLEALQASRERPLDGLIIASPSNPTGTMLTPEELDALAVYCEREGIVWCPMRFITGSPSARHGPCDIG